MRLTDVEKWGRIMGLKVVHIDRAQVSKDAAAKAFYENVLKPKWDTCSVSATAEAGIHIKNAPLSLDTVPLPLPARRMLAYAMGLWSSEETILPEMPARLSWAFASVILLTRTILRQKARRQGKRIRGELCTPR